MERSRSDGSISKCAIPCNRDILCLAINIRQIATARECIITYMFCAVRYCQHSKILVIGASCSSNPFHVLWNGVRLLSCSFGIAIQPCPRITACSIIVLTYSILAEKHSIDGLQTWVLFIYLYGFEGCASSEWVHVNRVDKCCFYILVWICGIRMSDTLNGLGYLYLCQFGIIVEGTPSHTLHDKCFSFISDLRRDV